MFLNRKKSSQTNDQSIWMNKDKRKAKHAYMAYTGSNPFSEERQMFKKKIHFTVKQGSN